MRASSAVRISDQSRLFVGRVSGGVPPPFIGPSLPSGARATRYANKRAEMWGLMREGLKVGLAVPDDPDLENQMTGLLYGFRDAQKGAEIILERKEHMKARGLSSPDRADALALTYAYPVLPRKDAGGPNALGGKPGTQALVDYDPFG